MIPAFLVVLALIVVLALQFRPGIQVTIQNTGSTPMKSVVLHVTGASYDLGEIAPGAEATARVRPTSESHLEIEFTIADGKTQRVNAGGYFESGYRGTIRVEIKDGVIDKFEDDIKLW
ncbi:MAG: hypothetical protein ACK52I_09255 [Pseudomonadota bacterium]|jgi:hypothetical protein